MATRAKSVGEDRRVAAVRAFNRFYTKQIGVVRPDFLASPFSLTEARVLYELAHGLSESSDVRKALELDPGYLSRILDRFERQGLITRGRSPDDGRRQVVGLTRKGSSAVKALDRRSNAELGAMLAEHSEDERRRLIEAMDSIRVILEGPRQEHESEIRAATPGDHGWVLERHAHLYADEEGWGDDFLTLIARVVADHLDGRDPEREAAWIAELDGQRAGAVYCTRADERTAKLRLLFVEPWARGSGIGTGLVDQCLDFARTVGYERIVLWTNSSLRSARRIYEAAGFEQIGESTDPIFPEGTFAQELALDLAR